MDAVTLPSPTKGIPTENSVPRVTLAPAVWVNVAVSWTDSLTVKVEDCVTDPSLLSMSWYPTLSGANAFTCPPVVSYVTDLNS